MKNIPAEHIAKKLNVSQSTVSKAIRHCSGVDSTTRQAILEEYRNTIPSSDTEFVIYAILPDVPRCFWSEMRSGINAGEQLTPAPIKYNICTQIRDESTVLEYLDEAERLQVRVVIVAAHITPAILHKLEHMTEKRLIILLSEYQDIKNTFYIGEDSYEEGYRMGQQYVSLYADRKLILFSIKDNVNVQKRLEGFMQALKEADPTLTKSVDYIEIDDKLIRNSKLLPAKLAPLLKDAAKKADSLCIYSPMGLQQIPLTAIKAKLIDRAVFLYHDYFIDQQNEKDSYGRCILTCNQDVYTQGMAAVTAATEYVKTGIYPEQKETFVSSIIKQL